MPLFKACGRAGCKELAPIDVGYCDDHAPEIAEERAEKKRVRQSNRRDTRGRTAAARVYRDPRWQPCRLVVLRRDGYQCQHCGTDDDLTVDHILGITGTDDDFDPEYCITLCRACHGRKDGRRSHDARRPMGEGDDDSDWREDEGDG